MVLVYPHTVAQAFIAIIMLIMVAPISIPILDAALLEAVLDMDVADLVAPGLELKIYFF